MIDFANHMNRVASISSQFDLARKGIKIFNETPEARMKYFTDAANELRETIEGGLDDKSHWIYSEEGIKAFIDGQSAVLKDRLDTVKNRFRQNELIILVSIFESIMKDIHREILRQNPTLLSHDRRIELGKLLSIGTENIINEEIEREIQSLDRKKFEDRILYYRNKLGIIIEDAIANFAKRALEFRNNILHEDPDINISTTDVGGALVACMLFPLMCIAQASVIYPNGFKKIEHLDAESLIKYLKKQ